MSDQNQMNMLTLLFFVVAYVCARYAVGIEHPCQWYLATRMKNYKQSFPEHD
jgi:hypothetical protein